MWSGINRAGADAPASVGLRYFRAESQADGVRLDWATGTELGTAGFKIQRSQDGGVTFDTLANIGFVPATGGPATPATYSRVDDTAVSGETYIYKLIEVENNGVELEVETVTIAHIVLPTATPIVVGGTAPAASPTRPTAATSTPVASATPTNTVVFATATATSSGSAATNTRRPTATATTASARPVVQATATRALVVNTPSATNPGAGSADTARLVLAQEETPAPAYPGPDASPAPGVTTEEGAANPSELPPTLIPLTDPTPYPAVTIPPLPPTIGVVGDGGEAAPSLTATPLPAASGAIIRGRLFLWAGFIIALLIFLAGVVGAIVLYQRQRE